MLRALLVTVLVSAAIAVAWRPATAAESGTSIVLARFVSAADRDAAIGLLRATAKGPVGATGFERIEVTGSAETAAAELFMLPGVLAAEPDGRVHIAFTPNDQYYASDPITGLGQWGVRITKTNLAWDVVRGSASLTIATVDTGIDLTHPDLIGAIVPGTRTITSQDASCAPGKNELDDNGHGSHVAGVAAASGNNGIGIAGVAFGVHVMAIKALDCLGAGNTSDAAAAVTYAADHGARVVNMSFASDHASAVMQAAVSYALGKGVVLVAAAGNCGQVSAQCPTANVTEYPAAYQGVLAVAATDPNDARASFSTANASVGIAAPGVSIISDYPQYLATLGARAPGYAVMSGTSMAAPLVSGVAALLLSQHPELTPAGAVSRLRATADLVGGKTGYSVEFGSGRVDAYRALTDPWATPTPTPTPTVTPIPTSTPTPIATSSPASTRTPSAAPTPTSAPPVPLLSPASAFCAAGRTGVATDAAFLPNITKTLGGANGWQTPFIIQNRGGTSTDLEISFYMFGSGECMSRQTVSGLLPGRSYAYSPNDDPRLPGNTQFSVVVQSFGAPIASVVNEVQGSGPSFESLAYDGASSGATKVYLPNVTRRFFGYDVPFIVQNLGSATTTANASFVSFDGTQTFNTTLIILPGRSGVIDPNATPGLIDGTQYAVTVTADQPVSVVVNAHDETNGPPVAYSHNGLASGAPKLYAPYAAKHGAADDRVSPVVIQNVGATAADATLTFTPLGANAGTTDQLFTFTGIAAGASRAFDPRFTVGTSNPCVAASATCLGNGEYSLAITSTGSVAAVVLPVTAATADGYTAAQAVAGRQYLPNVTRNLGGPSGYTTPIYLQSVGATGATLRWYRFADGSLQTTQLIALPAGGAIMIDPRSVSGLADDAQYAVIIDGTGGSVNAIVYEQSFSGGDGVMIYPGFAQ